MGTLPGYHCGGTAESFTVPSSWLFTRFSSTLLLKKGFSANCILTVKPDLTSGFSSTYTCAHVLFIADIRRVLGFRALAESDM